MSKIDFSVDSALCEMENKRFDLLQQFFYLMEAQYIVGVSANDEHEENARKLNQIYGAIKVLDEVIGDLAEVEYQNVVMQLTKEE